jgi:hypothetical protein
MLFELKINDDLGQYCDSEATTLGIAIRNFMHRPVFSHALSRKRGNFGLRKILGYITKEPEMVR